MSQSKNSVNWPLVEKWIQRDGIKIHWRVFGIPNIMAVDKSAFSDAEPMPRWVQPEKLILSTAITGAFYTKKENPNQAISPAEIIRSAEECIAAGAQIIHVHARDERDTMFSTPAFSRRPCRICAKIIPTWLSMPALSPSTLRKNGKWTR